MPNLFLSSPCNAGNALKAVRARRTNPAVRTLSSGHQHPANAPSPKAYFIAVPALPNTPLGPTLSSARGERRGSRGSRRRGRPGPPGRDAASSSGWAAAPSPWDGPTSKSRGMPADSGRFPARLPPCPVGRGSLALWLSWSFPLNVICSICFPHSFSFGLLFWALTANTSLSPWNFLCYFAIKSLIALETEFMWRSLPSPLRLKSFLLGSHYVLE